MPDAVRAELAPAGRLRAALNFSNTLLISTRGADPTGIAPDLARELATRAGASVELIGYANAGLAADAVATSSWDVAFIGAEPQRAGDITFSPAYVEIEATYLVQPGSILRSDRRCRSRRRPHRHGRARGLHVVPAADASPCGPG